MLTPDVHIERANLLLQQKRYRDAEREAGIALQHDPKNVEALKVIGHCRLDTHKFDEAVKIFEQCLGIQPDDHYVIYLLAFGYYQKNFLDKALRYVKEAIAMFPYNSGYFALIGYIELERKNYQQALDAANDGLEVNPEDVSCLNIRSSALFRLNRKEEAYESIDEALEIDPEDAHTHTNYGWHYLEKGKHKKAYEHFNQALKINPNNVSAREGYKAALKSKLPFYRWLLQYALFMERQSKGFRIGVIIGFFVLIRVLAAFTKGNGIVSILVGLVVLLYLLFVLLSWLGNSFANLYLMFTRHGRLILTPSEKWSSYGVGASIVSGIAVLVLSSYIEPKLALAGLILCSMSIPFSEMEFPVRPFKGSGRAVTAQLAIAFGLLTCLIAPFSFEVATLLGMIYFILFVGFMWSGSLTRA